MTCHPFLQLVRYKQWADRGLYDVIAPKLDLLPAQDAGLLLRILDHVHVVDVIFQHHLLGLRHTFPASHSENMPDFQALSRSTNELNDWYTRYASNLPESDFDEPVHLVFTNGASASMRRGEIILHVCLHGTYHRGNAGLILQKNNISPNNDRMTDFLEAAA